MSKSILDKLEKIDRRILFWLVTAVVIIPLVRPVGIPLPIDPMTREFYDAVTSIPAGSYVVLAQDTNPANFPEWGGGLVAVCKILSKMDVKVVSWSLDTPDDTLIWEIYCKPIFEKAGKVYGVDYVYFGWLPGYEAVCTRTATDMPGILKEDSYGTKYEELPIMEGITNAAQFDAIILCGMSNWPYVRTDWITAYNVPAYSIMKAGDIASLMPTYLSGLISAVCKSMRGSAELELLIGEPGVACGGMEGTTFAMGFMVLIIVFSNIIYFAKRSKEANE